MQGSVFTPKQGNGRKTTQKQTSSRYFRLKDRSQSPNVTEDQSQFPEYHKNPLDTDFRDFTVSTRNLNVKNEAKDKKGTSRVSDSDSEGRAGWGREEDEKREVHVRGPSQSQSQHEASSGYRCEEGRQGGSKGGEVGKQVEGRRGPGPEGKGQEVWRAANRRKAERTGREAPEKDEEREERAGKCESGGGVQLVSSGGKHEAPTNGTPQQPTTADTSSLPRISPVSLPSSLSSSPPACLSSPSVPAPSPAPPSDSSAYSPSSRPAASSSLPSPVPSTIFFSPSPAPPSSPAQTCRALPSLPRTPSPLHPASPASCSRGSSPPFTSSALPLALLDPPSPSPSPSPPLDMNTHAHAHAAIPRLPSRHRTTAHSPAITSRSTSTITNFPNSVSRLESDFMSENEDNLPELYESSPEDVSDYRKPGKTGSSADYSENQATLSSPPRPNHPYRIPDPISDEITPHIDGKLNTLGVPVLFPQNSQTSSGLPCKACINGGIETNEVLSHPRARAMSDPSRLLGERVEIRNFASPENWMYSEIPEMEKEIPVPIAVDVEADGEGGGEERAARRTEAGRESGAEQRNAREEEAGVGNGVGEGEAVGVYVDEVIGGRDTAGMGTSVNSVGRPEGSEGAEKREVRHGDGGLEREEGEETGNIGEKDREERPAGQREEVREGLDMPAEVAEEARRESQEGPAPRRQYLEYRQNGNIREAPEIFVSELSIPKHVIPDDNELVDVVPSAISSPKRSFFQKVFPSGLCGTGDSREPPVSSEQYRDIVTQTQNLPLSSEIRRNPDQVSKSFFPSCSIWSCLPKKRSPPVRNAHRENSLYGNPNTRSIYPHTSTSLSSLHSSTSPSEAIRTHPSNTTVSLEYTRDDNAPMALEDLRLRTNPHTNANTTADISHTSSTHFSSHPLPKSHAHTNARTHNHTGASASARTGVHESILSDKGPLTLDALTILPVTSTLARPSQPHHFLSLPALLSHTTPAADTSASRPASASADTVPLYRPRPSSSIPSARRRPVPPRASTSSAPAAPTASMTQSTSTPPALHSPTPITASSTSSSTSSSSTPSTLPSSNPRPALAASSSTSPTSPSAAAAAASTPLPILSHHNPSIPTAPTTAPTTASTSSSSSSLFPSPLSPPATTPVHVSAQAPPTPPPSSPRRASRGLPAPLAPAQDSALHSSTSPRTQPALPAASSPAPMPTHTSPSRLRAALAAPTASSPLSVPAPGSPPSTNSGSLSTPHTSSPHAALPLSPIRSPHVSLRELHQLATHSPLPSVHTRSPLASLPIHARAHTPPRSAVQQYVLPTHRLMPRPLPSPSGAASPASLAPSSYTVAPSPSRLPASFSPHPQHSSHPALSALSPVSPRHVSYKYTQHQPPPSPLPPPPTPPPLPSPPLKEEEKFERRVGKSGKKGTRAHNFPGSGKIRSNYQNPDAHEPQEVHEDLDASRDGNPYLEMGNNSGKNNFTPEKAKNIWRQSSAYDQAWGWRNGGNDPESMAFPNYQYSERSGDDTPSGKEEDFSPHDRESNVLQKKLDIPTETSDFPSDEECVAIGMDSGDSYPEFPIPIPHRIRDRESMYIFPPQRRESRFVRPPPPPQPLPAPLRSLPVGEAPVPTPPTAAQTAVNIPVAPSLLPAPPLAPPISPSRSPAQPTANISTSTSTPMTRTTATSTGATAPTKTSVPASTPSASMSASLSASVPTSAHRGTTGPTSATADAGTSTAAPIRAPMAPIAPSVTAVHTRGPTPTSAASHDIAPISTHTGGVGTYDHMDPRSSLSARAVVSTRGTETSRAGRAVDGAGRDTIGGRSRVEAGVAPGGIRERGSGVGSVGVGSGGMGEAAGDASTERDVGHGGVSSAGHGGVEGEAQHVGIAQAQDGDGGGGGGSGAGSGGAGVAGRAVQEEKRQSTEGGDEAPRQGLVATRRKEIAKPTPERGFTPDFRSRLDKFPERLNFLENASLANSSIPIGSIIPEKGVNPLALALSTTAASSLFRENVARAHDFPEMSDYAEGPGKTRDFLRKKTYIPELYSETEWGKSEIETRSLAVPSESRKIDSGRELPEVWETEPDIQDSYDRDRAGEGAAGESADSEEGSMRQQRQHRREERTSSAPTSISTFSPASTSTSASTSTPAIGTPPPTLAVEREAAVSSATSTATPTSIDIADTANGSAGLGNGRGVTAVTNVGDNVGADDVGAVDGVSGVSGGAGNVGGSGNVAGAVTYPRERAGSTTHTDITTVRTSASLPTITPSTTTAVETTAPSSTATPSDIDAASALRHGTTIATGTNVASRSDIGAVSGNATHVAASGGSADVVRTGVGVDTGVGTGVSRSKRLSPLLVHDDGIVVRAFVTPRSRAAPSHISEGFQEKSRAFRKLREMEIPSSWESPVAHNYVYSPMESPFSGLILRKKQSGKHRSRELGILEEDFPISTWPIMELERLDETESDEEGGHVFGKKHGFLPKGEIRKEEPVSVSVFHAEEPCPEREQTYGREGLGKKRISEPASPHIIPISTTESEHTPPGEVLEEQLFPGKDIDNSGVIHLPSRAPVSAASITTTLTPARTQPPTSASPPEPTTVPTHLPSAHASSSMAEVASGNAPITSVIAPAASTSAPRISTITPTATHRIASTTPITATAAAFGGSTTTSTATTAVGAAAHEGAAAGTDGVAGSADARRPRHYECVDSDSIWATDRPLTAVSVGADNGSVDGAATSAVGHAYVDKSSVWKAYNDSDVIITTAASAAAPARSISSIPSTASAAPVTSLTYALAGSAAVSPSTATSVTLAHAGARGVLTEEPEGGRDGYSRLMKVQESVPEKPKISGKVIELTDFIANIPVKPKVSATTEPKVDTVFPSSAPEIHHYHLLSHQFSGKSETPGKRSLRELRDFPSLTKLMHMREAPLPVACVHDSCVGNTVDPENIPPTEPEITGYTYIPEPDFPVTIPEEEVPVLENYTEEVPDNTAIPNMTRVSDERHDQYVDENSEFLWKPENADIPRPITFATWPTEEDREKAFRKKRVRAILGLSEELNGKSISGASSASTDSGATGSSRSLFSDSVSNSGIDAMIPTSSEEDAEITAMVKTREENRWIGQKDTVGTEDVNEAAGEGKSGGKPRGRAGRGPREEEEGKQVRIEREITRGRKTVTISEPQDEIGAGREVKKPPTGYMGEGQEGVARAAEGRVAELEGGGEEEGVEKEGEDAEWEYLNRLKHQQRRRKRNSKSQDRQELGKSHSVNSEDFEEFNRNRSIHKHPKFSRSRSTPEPKTQKRTMLIKLPSSASSSSLSSSSPSSPSSASSTASSTASPTATSLRPSSTSRGSSHHPHPNIASSTSPPLLPPVSPHPLPPAHPHLPPASPTPAAQAAPGATAAAPAIPPPTSPPRLKVPQSPRLPLPSPHAASQSNAAPSLSSPATSTASLVASSPAHSPARSRPQALPAPTSPSRPPAPTSASVSASVPTSTGLHITAATATANTANTATTATTVTSAATTTAGTSIPTAAYTPTTTAAPAGVALNAATPTHLHHGAAVPPSLSTPTPLSIPLWSPASSGLSLAPTLISVAPSVFSEASTNPLLLLHQQHTHTQTHAHAHARVHTHAHTRGQGHTRKHTHTHARPDLHVHTHLPSHKDTSTHTDTYTRMELHTHADPCLPTDANAPAHSPLPPAPSPPQTHTHTPTHTHTHTHPFTHLYPMQRSSSTYSLALSSLTHASSLSSCSTFSDVTSTCSGLPWEHHDRHCTYADLPPDHPFARLHTGGGARAHEPILYNESLLYGECHLYNETALYSESPLYGGVQPQRIRETTTAPSTLDLSVSQSSSPSSSPSVLPSTAQAEIAEIVSPVRTRTAPPIPGAPVCATEAPPHTLDTPTPTIDAAMVPGETPAFVVDRQATQVDRAIPVCDTSTLVTKLMTMEAHEVDESPTSTGMSTPATEESILAPATAAAPPSSAAPSPPTASQPLATATPVVAQPPPSTDLTPAAMLATSLLQVPIIPVVTLAASPPLPALSLATAVTPSSSRSTSTSTATSSSASSPSSSAPTPAPAVTLPPTATPPLPTSLPSSLAPPVPLITPSMPVAIPVPMAVSLSMPAVVVALAPIAPAMAPSSTQPPVPAPAPALVPAAAPVSTTVSASAPAPVALPPPPPAADTATHTAVGTSPVAPVVGERNVARISVAATRMDGSAATANGDVGTTTVSAVKVEDTSTCKTSPDVRTDGVGGDVATIDAHGDEAGVFRTSSDTNAVYVEKARSHVHGSGGTPSLDRAEGCGVTSGHGDDVDNTGMADTSPIEIPHVITPAAAALTDSDTTAPLAFSSASALPATTPASVAAPASALPVPVTRVCAATPSGPSGTSFGDAITAATAPVTINTIAAPPVVLLPVTILPVPLPHVAVAPTLAPVPAAATLNASAHAAAHQVTHTPPATVPVADTTTAPVGAAMASNVTATPPSISPRTRTTIGAEDGAGAPPAATSAATVTTAVEAVLTTLDSGAAIAKTTVHSDVLASRASLHFPNDDGGSTLTVIGSPLGERAIAVSCSSDASASPTTLSSDVVVSQPSLLDTPMATYPTMPPSTVAVGAPVILPAGVPVTAAVVVSATASAARIRIGVDKHGGTRVEVRLRSHTATGSKDNNATSITTITTTSDSTNTSLSTPSAVAGTTAHDNGTVEVASSLHARIPAQSKPIARSTTEADGTSPATSLSNTSISSSTGPLPLSPTASSTGAPTSASAVAAASTDFATTPLIRTPRTTGTHVITAPTATAAPAVETASTINAPMHVPSPQPVTSRSACSMQPLLFSLVTPMDVSALSMLPANTPPPALHGLARTPSPQPTRSSTHAPSLLPTSGSAPLSPEVPPAALLPSPPLPRPPAAHTPSLPLPHIPSPSASVHAPLGSLLSPLLPSRPPALASNSTSTSTSSPLSSPVKQPPEKHNFGRWTVNSESLWLLTSEDDIYTGHSVDAAAADSVDLGVRGSGDSEVAVDQSGAAVADGEHNIHQGGKIEKKDDTIFESNELPSQYVRNIGNTEDKWILLEDYIAMTHESRKSASRPGIFRDKPDQTDNNERSPPKSRVSALLQKIKRKLSFRESEPTDKISNTTDSDSAIAAASIPFTAIPNIVTTTTTTTTHPTDAPNTASISLPPPALTAPAASEPPPRRHPHTHTNAHARADTQPVSPPHPSSPSPLARSPTSSPHSPSSSSVSSATNNTTSAGASAEGPSTFRTHTSTILASTPRARARTVRTGTGGQQSAIGLPPIFPFRASRQPPLQPPRLPLHAQIQPQPELPQLPPLPLSATAPAPLSLPLHHQQQPQQPLPSAVAPHPQQQGKLKSQDFPLSKYQALPPLLAAQTTSALPSVTSSPLSLRPPAQSTMSTDSTDPYSTGGQLWTGSEHRMQCSLDNLPELHLFPRIYSLATLDNLLSSYTLALPAHPSHNITPLISRDQYTGVGDMRQAVADDKADKKHHNKNGDAPIPPLLKDQQFGCFQKDTDTHRGFEDLSTPRGNGTGSGRDAHHQRRDSRESMHDTLYSHVNKPRSTLAGKRKRVRSVDQSAWNNALVMYRKGRSASEGDHADQRERATSCASRHEGQDTQPSQTSSPIDQLGPFGEEYIPSGIISMSPALMKKLNLIPTYAQMSGTLHDPNVNCHFRISVDLREISGLTEEYNVICRFSYPLFDQNHPSQTSPPVKTISGEKVDIPNGFFSCEFVTTENHLAQALVNRPLIIEVLHRDYKGQAENTDDSLFANDDIIGSARVNMMSLFDTPWFQDSNSNDSTLNSLLRVIDNTSPILSITNNTPIGALRLLLTLESFGEYLGDTGMESGANDQDVNAGIGVDGDNGEQEKAGGKESVVIENVVATGTMRRQDGQSAMGLGDSMNLTAQDLGNISAFPDTQFSGSENGNPDSPDSPRTVRFQENVTVQDIPKRTQSESTPSSGTHEPENYVFPTPGSSESLPHQYISPSSHSGSTVVNPTIDTEALDYQTAWELTMWKRAEQAKWLAKLQEKETQRMRDIDVEWKKQEVIREQQYQKRQRDVAKLEKKLKDSLFEVEQQEKRLRLGEDELRLRLANVEKEIDSAKKDALLSVQRIKDQHKHQLGMARMVHDELKRQYDIVKAKLAASQSRYNDLEEEYRAYKAKWQKSSSGQLRMLLQEKEQQVDQLTNQVESLTQKLGATKAHLVRCLQEVARMKKEQENSTRQRLELERQDVERLRMELLAKQQSAGARRDGEELKKIKMELEELLQEGRGRDTGVHALATLGGGGGSSSGHMGGIGGLSTGASTGVGGVGSSVGNSAVDHRHYDSIGDSMYGHTKGVPAVGVGIGTNAGSGIIHHQNSENFIFGDRSVRGGGILPTSSGVSEFAEIPSIYGSGNMLNEDSSGLQSLLSSLQLQSTQDIMGKINASTTQTQPNHSKGISTGASLGKSTGTGTSGMGLSNSNPNIDNILQTPTMQTNAFMKKPYPHTAESAQFAENTPFSGHAQTALRNDVYPSKSSHTTINPGNVSRNSDMEAETRRLLRERQDLLSCGAFDAQHPVICEMDRKIRELQSVQGNLGINTN